MPEENYKQIDEFFCQVYYHGEEQLTPDQLEEEWEKIASDKDLFDWAMSTHKQQTGCEVVNGRYILDYALRHHLDDMPEEIRDNIVREVFTNEVVRNEYAGEIGCNKESFMLLILQDPNIQLADEYGAIAEIEAQKSVDGKLTSHGSGNYDIRYWILKNPNWSFPGKQRLVQRFWENPSDSSDYEEYIESLETDIINSNIYTGAYLSIDYLYSYTYEELLEIYESEAAAKQIMDEIDFCRRLTLLGSKTPVFSDKKISELLKNIAKTKEATNLKFGVRTCDCVDEDGPFSENYYLDASRKTREKAREYYTQNFDINYLRVMAEEIGPGFSKYYFSRRIANDVLEELGIEQTGIPEKDDKYLKRGAIWYFARSLGLVQETLVDYARRKNADEWRNDSWDKIQEIFTGLTSGKNADVAMATYASKTLKYQGFMRPELRNKKEN